LFDQIDLLQYCSHIVLLPEQNHQPKQQGSHIIILMKTT
jgi:hypothetical protein